MTTANGRHEFAPPPTPGFLRALGMAILAHGLLVGMLTVGVQWKRDATPSTFEAELWTALPQQAAPPAAESMPVPVEPPQPPIPAVAVVTQKPTPPLRPIEPALTPDADIALAKEKAKLLREKQLQQEQEKKKRQRLEDEKLAQLELKKLQKEKLEKAERAKKAQEKIQENREKATKDAKSAEVTKQKAALAKEEAQKLEELRQQNLKRIAGMAGTAAGTGDARSTGTAAQSSGPSAGYAGRIRALLKRNTTYTETVSGNPTAEVEVRTSADGTITSRKLLKSSGVKSWDDAVLSAIDKAEVLPRDVDGRIPSPIIIVHSPKD